jgi:Domain of unknown function (DUF222)/HNH endonuclease
MAGSTLDRLSEDLDALVAAGAEQFSDGASIEVLHRELARLEAFVTEATSAFEASEEWAADGAKTAAAWVATRCRLPRNTARRRVRLGRALRQLPQCAEAWREGRIGSDQAKALASARRHRTESSMQRDEEMLVSYAVGMGFEDFARALAYWKQLADPEGADEAEEARKARRDAYVEESISGMYLGQVTLDPISGAIVSDELKRLEEDLFEADSKEAAERLGRRATLEELPRTSAQRRADALVEMAIRSASMPADATRPAPLFSVLVGYETMHGRICELENGPVVAPSALDPWIGSAYFERALFTLGGRVEVSTRARLFTGGTRRALELRDRRCTHPYCDAPAEDCQGDHIDPYAEGGETTQENGRLLCGFHNRLRNQAERKRPPPGDPPAA